MMTSQSSTTSNGRKKVAPLEVEPLNGNHHDDGEYGQQKEEQERQLPVHPMIFIHNGWLLLWAYIDYYRAITFPIGAFLLILAVIFTLESIAYASTKTHVAVIDTDYSDAHSEFALKMKQIDHWCLNGGDDDCICDDPTLPIPNEQEKGWKKAHRLNKDLLDKFGANLRDVDVVFIGDEVTEEWNGRWLGAPINDLEPIQKFWNKTFTRAGGGDVDGIALGIAGDSIPNVLWRLQHGEMPDDLMPKVWWISVGGNDLDKGQCSEEATLLGILRLAEYIADNRPDSKVVINSILPRVHKVTSLVKNSQFKPFDLYPSIKVVNEQLDEFCKKNTDYEFFDATSIFMTSTGSAKGKHDHGHSHEELVPDLITTQGQVLAAGHKAWGKPVLEEIKRILFDEMYQYDSNNFDDMYTDDYSNV